MTKRLYRCTLTAALIVVVARPAVADNWPVFGYDPARSGFNAAEHRLTVATVRRLRERWRVSFGAIADSTPILLDRVRTARGVRAVIFQTTVTGETFAVDAISGGVLWRFTTHGPHITTSTPAADSSSSVIYAPGVDGMVHALSAATGRELPVPGFPARITRMPMTEKVSSPLNLANGFLYAVTSGYDGDNEPYDGHVVSVRLRDGQTSVFASLCSGLRMLPTPTSCRAQRSGIWARGGAVVDPVRALGDRIYVATGNGDFTADRGGDDYGDSVIALAANLSNIVGSYTPANYRELWNRNLDLGSTAPALLPLQRNSKTPLMLVQGGKDARLRLIDRDPLPRIGRELQVTVLPRRLFSAPAVWTDRAGRTWVILGFSDAVQAYLLVTDANGRSRLLGVWQSTGGQSFGDGSSPVVANGVVFAAFNGAIFALNAINGQQLWTSAADTVGGSIGAIHWQSPIVVNGWVYCSDEGGNLTAYALAARS